MVIMPLPHVNSDTRSAFAGGVVAIGFGNGAHETAAIAQMPHASSNFFIAVELMDGDEMFHILIRH